MVVGGRGVGVDDVLSLLVFELQEKGLGLSVVLPPVQNQEHVSVRNIG